MSAISKISTAVKNFSGKPMSVMSKALGAATCAAVIYDAHVNGKERAISKNSLDTADRFEKAYKNYLVSDSESATVSQMKKFWFNSQTGLSYPHIFSSTAGYLGGFFSTVINDLPYLLLSAVAIKYNKIGKVAGLLLSAAGIKTLMYDVAGIGSKTRK